MRYGRAPAAIDGRLAASWPRAFAALGAFIAGAANVALAALVMGRETTGAYGPPSHRGSFSVDLLEPTAAMPRGEA